VRKQGEVEGDEEVEERRTSRGQLAGEWEVEQRDIRSCTDVYCSSQNCKSERRGDETVRRCKRERRRRRSGPSRRANARADDVVQKFIVVGGRAELGEAKRRSVLSNKGRKEGSMVVNKRYAGAEHLRREIYEASITSSSKPRREDEKQQGYGGKWDSICEGKREGGDV
jgi:hypothetical protein